jgi:hypothetical protein
VAATLEVAAGAERGNSDWELRALLETIFVGDVTFKPMAEEKNRSKDIVLWIITVVLVALAIYWYQKPR